MCLNHCEAVGKKNEEEEEEGNITAFDAVFKIKMCLTDMDIFYLLYNQVTSYGNLGSHT